MCPGELGHGEMEVMLYMLDKVRATMQRSVLRRLSCLSFGGACIGQGLGEQPETGAREPSEKEEAGGGGS